MKTIGVGLIGWGFMGRTHAHALQSIPLFYPGADFRVRRVCVCSRRMEMARQAAQDAGFERWTDDYRQLLTDPEIDAVSVCTPNELHEEMVVALLKAGKHIYVDKPLAVTAESADRIAAAARESKAFTGMGEVWAASSAACMVPESVGAMCRVMAPSYPSAARRSNARENAWGEG